MIDETHIQYTSLSYRKGQFEMKVLSEISRLEKIPRQPAIFILQTQTLSLKGDTNERDIQISLDDFNQRKITPIDPGKNWTPTFILMIYPIRFCEEYSVI